jgi:molybdenum cofactor biosynthesis enzyme MoaA
MFCKKPLERKNRLSDLMVSNADETVSSSLHNDMWLCQIPFKKFRGVSRDSLTQSLQGIDSLNISLSLRLEPGNPGLETILDFSHDGSSGCVLQLRTELGMSDSELCWSCSGYTLNARVKPGSWISLSCGYDSVRREAWMSLSDGSRMICAVPAAPFSTTETLLGIGYWIGGNSREFRGDMENLCVAASGMDLIEVSRMEEDILILDDSSHIAQDVDGGTIVSNSEEELALISDGGRKNRRGRFSDGILELAIRLRKFGGVAKKYADLFRTSRWRISTSFNGSDKANTSERIGDVRGVPEMVSGYLAEFVSYAEREDVIGAAHYLNQLHNLGYRVRILSSALGKFEILVSDEEENLKDFLSEVLLIDMRRLRDTPMSMYVSALISGAQTLGRRGEWVESKTFLKAHLKEYSNASNHFIRDVELAQSRFIDEGESATLLVRNLAIGGLDYLDHFRGKYCNHPFDDMEIRSDGEIFVCCPSYLPYSIGNAFKVNSIDEVKSSQVMVKIKDSIIRQDFRYCRWMHCEKIQNGLGPIPEQAKIDYEPIDFRLSYDPTCNLWCSSCRTEKIVAKGAERERFMRLTDEIVLPMLKTASSCMMSGYGDVFASRACRKILETANAEEYPNLKFDFITNGVLFTREEWAKFPGIHDMVRSIRVSIDASCKKTYDQIRLGGDWGVLMQNLDFISELRRQNVIERFMISMVVQEGNFTEMSDFARMAKRLGCDFAIFEAIMDWNTSSVEVFQRKAVHYSTHPSYGMFQQELERTFEILPISDAQSVPKLGSLGFETLASTNF